MTINAKTESGTPSKSRTKRRLFWFAALAFVALLAGTLIYVGLTESQEERAAYTWNLHLVWADGASSLASIDVRQDDKSLKQEISQAILPFFNAATSPKQKIVGTLTVEHEEGRRFQASGWERFTSRIKAFLGAKQVTVTMTISEKTTCTFPFIPNPSGGVTIGLTSIDGGELTPEIQFATEWSVKDRTEWVASRILQRIRLAQGWAKPSDNGFDEDMYRRLKEKSQ